MINCRNAHRRIEEQDRDEQLNEETSQHLRDCAECRTFYDEQLKLRAWAANLGVVEAPGDFDFRLRARLANEESASRSPGGRSFRFGYAAFGLLLLLGAGGLFWRVLRPAENLSSNEISRTGGTTTTRQAETIGVSTASGPGNVVAQDSGTRSGSASQRNSGTSPRFVARNNANNGRVASRDFSSAGAPITRAQNAAVFAIDASNQPLRLSLDDASGVSRTISLPSVTFGSQRVLSSARSTRGVW